MSVLTTAEKASYDTAVTRSASLDAIPNPVAARTMNGQKMTGLGAGAAAGDALRWEQGIKCLGHWGNTTNAGNATQRFLQAGNVAIAGTPTTTESNGQVAMPVAGNLVAIQYTGSAGITTDTQAITARINGVDSTLTCTVAISGTTASDAAQSPSVAAGNYVSAGYKQSGTSAAVTTTPRVSIGWR
jgi:hypothetical protein